jgi:hypothetical protein
VNIVRNIVSILYALNFRPQQILNPGDRFCVVEIIRAEENQIQLNEI